ncbi:MAG: DUF4340 domain-containing protein [Pseudomonadota bacterium]
MQKNIGILGGVAIVQLLLVAWFWFGSPGTDDAADNLLVFSQSGVTKLRVSDGESATTVLKEGERWLVDGAQADEKKVTEVLDKLAQLTAPWPVAATTGSAERFEVTEANHQRHIQLYVGDDLAGELYLGTSPGYQRVHARRADDDNIYSIKLSNYELGTGLDAWLDKTLMAVDGEIDALTFTDTKDAGTQTSIKKTADASAGWEVNGVVADPTKIETYVNRFGNLRVLGLAEQTLVESAELVATIELTSGGEEVVYDLLGVLAAEPESPDAVSDYLIRREGIEHTYRLATYVAEQLLMHDVDFVSS